MSSEQKSNSSSYHQTIPHEMQSHIAQYYIVRIFFFMASPSECTSNRFYMQKLTPVTWFQLLGLLEGYYHLDLWDFQANVQQIDSYALHEFTMCRTSVPKIYIPKSNFHPQRACLWSACQPESLKLSTAIPTTLSYQRDSVLITQCNLHM
jgi:hypothetical protein